MPIDTITGKHNDSSWTSGIDYTTNKPPKGNSHNKNIDVVIPVPGKSWRNDVVDNEGVDGSLIPRDPSLSGMGNINNPDRITPFVSVYFGFDQFAVSESERAKLSKTFQYVLSNPGTKLIAEGHTDWRGTNEYNLALGDRRANSVRNYLINLGAPDNISISSKGELEATENIEKNDPRAQEDRRVDVFVIK